MTFMLALLARLTPFFGLVAMLILRRQWREHVPVYAFLGYATLLHAAAHAEFRLSDPFQPLLFMLIGGAIVLTGKRIQQQWLYQAPKKYLITTNEKTKL
jgi:hypothetical protein